MKILIEKELFQWEKDREVLVRTSVLENKPSFLQFYNSKTELSKEVSLTDGKALIPNPLLKEALPIMVLACDSKGQVITRREFKVLKRVRPENYIDDDDSGSDVPEGTREIIYDGGEEI